MRIIDRKAFLALPAGVVFQKYNPVNFDVPMLKGETLGNDFVAAELSAHVVADNSAEWVDVIMGAVEHNRSLAVEFGYGGRDGMFDEDQLFAVWTREEFAGFESWIRRVMTDYPAINGLLDKIAP
jgi:hypothetical protein